MDNISQNLQDMPKRYIGSVLHEYVLGLLFEKGRVLGYFPLPEFMPYAETKHRIDMVWIDDEGDISAGFEVDKTIYPKSIRKLRTLPKESSKIIISIGLGRQALDTNFATEYGIDVFDFTQVAMGKYKQIRNREC